MKTPVQLLKDRRSSAVKDVRAIEIQLAHLNESAEPTRIKADLRSIAAMFHEYIATLDESIHDIECVMLASVTERTQILALRSTQTGLSRPLRGWRDTRSTPTAVVRFST